MSGGTHTYALLDVSTATFQEIHDRLKAAGYEHAFMRGDTVIDMHGIGLRASAAREQSVTAEQRLKSIAALLGHADVPVDVDVLERDIIFLKRLSARLDHAGESST